MQLQKVDANQVISDFGFDDVTDEEVEDIINMGCEAYNYYFTYDGFEDILSCIPQNNYVLSVISNYDWDDYTYDEIENIIETGMVCDGVGLDCNDLGTVFLEYNADKEEIDEYKAQIEEYESQIAELQEKVDDYDHTITVFFSIAFIVVIIAFLFGGVRK